MIIANIPALMRDKSNWVGWRYEIKIDPKTQEEKKTKVPYCLHSQYRKASATDKSTWNTFDTACKCLSLFDGVGFVFDRGLTGIDLDHCFTDGVLADWAREIITTMNSYTELSPSGEGLHIICEGMIPAAKGTRKNGIEIYSRERFFTVTGDVFEGRLEIYNRELDIARLYHKVNPMPEVVTKPVANEPVSTFDNGKFTLQDLLTELINTNKKFYNIWHHITHHESQSNYDLQIVIEALDHGFNDTESWWMVKENRILHNADPKKADRLDYHLSTMNAAKQFINARPDLSNVVALTQPEEKKQELLIDSKTILKPSEPMQWAIENYLPQTGIVWIAGQWSTYKTFIVLDMCFSIAAGIEWFGNEVTQGKIIYLAGEGHSGLGKRLRGIELDKGSEYPQASFLLTKSAVMVNDVTAFNHLLLELKEKHSDTRVIVVDTKSANMMGSDSDPAVMNQFINMLRILEKSLRCLIIVVDHVGHMAKDRPRGASQQMGAADAVYMVEREPESHFVTMRVEKDPKDFDRPQTVHFHAVPIELPEEWNDKHGKPQSTLVMHVASQQAATATVQLDSALHMGVSQTKLIRLLVSKYSEVRERLNDPDSARIDTRYLREQCKQLGMNIKNFGRWVDELEERGLILREGNDLSPQMAAINLMGICDGQINAQEGTGSAIAQASNLSLPVDGTEVAV